MPSKRAGVGDWLCTTAGGVKTSEDMAKERLASMSGASGASGAYLWPLGGAGDRLHLPTHRRRTVLRIGDPTCLP